MAASAKSVLWLALAAVAFGPLAAACGGPSTPSPTPSGPATEQITAILGTTVLRTGTQRVAFLLESESGLVTESSVEVKNFPAAPETSPFQVTRASFHGWPYGVRGSYVTSLTFDRPGRWRLDITLDTGPHRRSTELLVDVARETSVVEIGAMAPFSNTKTLRDANGDLSTITTDPNPDPDLYRVSVAESLFSGKPTVVVFASPAFCTSPTCGPQVETVVQVKDAYATEADFVHVEVYDNPAEIRGDLSRAVFSPALAEWGIDAVPHYVNESWVFIVGRNARVVQRFEGYATFGEIEEGLQAALQSS